MEEDVMQEEDHRGSSSSSASVRQQQSSKVAALEMSAANLHLHPEENCNPTEQYCDDDDALTYSAMTTSAVASPSHYHHNFRWSGTTRNLHHRHRRIATWDGDGKLQLSRRNAEIISQNSPSKYKTEDANTSDPLVIAARNATTAVEGNSGRIMRRRQQPRQRHLDEEDQQLQQNHEMQPNTTTTVLLMNDCSCSSVTEEDEEDEEEEDDDGVESHANAPLPTSAAAIPPLNDFLGGLHRERQSRQQLQLRPPSFVHHWPQQLQHHATLSNLDADDEVDKDGRDCRSHDNSGHDLVGFNYGNNVIISNGMTVVGEQEEERSRKTAASSLSHSSGGAVIDPTTEVVPKWKRTVLLPSHSSLY
jgi:hypothetical protein